MVALYSDLFSKEYINVEQIFVTEILVNLLMV